MNETATQCPEAPPKRFVKFRTDKFDAYTLEQLGLTSNVKKARFIGCGIATMSRIRAGKQNPGPQFIALVYDAIGARGGDGADFFDFHGTGA